MIIVMDQLLHYSGRIYTQREMRIINKLGAKGGLMGVPAGTTHLGITLSLSSCRYCITLMTMIGMMVWMAAFG
jgi:hypothetical protein